MMKKIWFHLTGCSNRMNAILFLAGLMLVSVVNAQQANGNDATADVMIETQNVSSSAFILELINETQTAAALSPVGEPGFDFTTREWLKERNKKGYYQLGDITMRLRLGNSGDWMNFSSAERREPVVQLPSSQKVLAAAELNNSFDEGMPLKVVRYWEEGNGKLVLRFELRNEQVTDVEIGALGIPMVFNNILNGKHLDDVHVDNVFFDPYIGMDAGYLQVIRLSGNGQVLLVVPHGKSPFEAYRPLLDDPMRRGITFEGFHEWMVHSKAYAEQEWKGAEQWNVPTSRILKPGESYSVGVELILSENIHAIEETLIKHQRPVAVGVPGYVLPMDVKAKLFLKHGQDIVSVDVEPKGALAVEKDGATPNKWTSFKVKGKKWGRARLSIGYADGTMQTISYKVIKPESEVVADNGRFLTNEQWFDDKDDFFSRAPSVMTYDYENKEIVTQDSRAWIAGLSDEGGAGSWTNAMMKQFIQPDVDEMKKLEEFVTKTLWGGIQYSDGDRKYGVRKSMFYYEPDSVPEGTYSSDVDYSTWAAWSKEATESTVRSYNYPHVVAAHWVMYRLARNYKGLVKENSWEWYLENAFHTSLAMMQQAPYYAQFGQMEGTIFLLVLDDLQREGWDEMAGNLEMTMKLRADHWASLNYPFGSEMPWDSTGQEEVYMWSKYFGFDEKAMVTLRAILAYMPTVPHWGYNGSARRYWDFLYAGKLSRVERQLHHYGSSLNSIPVLHAYKENPDDFYLLRVGHGGVIGAISNITQDGFAPCAFHSFPSTLEIDGISGDYGPSFFGYSVNTATFLTHHYEFGWLAFGGNVSEIKGWISVDVTTAAKSTVYIAPLGLEFQLDAGKFKSIAYNPVSKEVRVELESQNSFTPEALLRVKDYVDGSHERFAIGKLKTNSRGLYVVPLKKKPVSFVVKTVKI